MNDGATEITMIQLAERGGVKIETTESLGLFDFVSKQCEQLRTLISDRGAVLLRGFLSGPQDFLRVAEAVSQVLVRDYGDLPPADQDATYFATPYDARLDILFHNEASHTPITPALQMFYCERPAICGGEWRLADGVLIAASLEDDVLRAFSERGLLYTRRFIPGFDVSWQDFFKVNEPDYAISIANNSGYSTSWKTNDRVLEIARLAPAVINHGTTWFNQLLLHHPHALPERTKKLTDRLASRYGYPREVRFGDGGVITESLVDKIRDAYEAASFTVETRDGDLLLVNNLRFAHSRRPYSGDRSVRVALADPIEVRKLR